MRASHRICAPLVATAMLGLSGCGTNLNDVLYQTVSASGRSLLDIFLTDLQNNLADSLDQTTPSQTGDQTDGGITPPVDNTPIGELTGVPGTGDGIFVSNNCSACHCADASGGCALNAPSLIGVTTDILDGRVRGDVEHPGGKFNFSNQDVVDLQAYLASLGGG